MKKATTEESRPAWLVRMENGTIGEARTRSFLIDRFWILERSVDVDGADFFIQRRLTGVNLLDKEPPRLGVVQVKFYGSDSTTQYLHKEYVVDSNGNPRNEFFLMCHAGSEDKAISYMLSAEDIINDFNLTDAKHSKPNCFTIPGKTLLTSNSYKIVSNDLALDRIERALDRADFINNRRFMSWVLPSASAATSKILPLYQEPLDNWYGDIPEQFVELKKKVQRASFDIEEIAEKLNAILETDDPEKALGIAEDLDHEYGRHISFQDGLFDEDFYSVVRQHKERHGNLKSAGMRDLYFKLQKDCSSYICSNLGKHMPIDRETAYVLTIAYDHKNLSEWNFSADLKDVEGLFEKREGEHWLHEDAPSSEGILSFSPGVLNAYIMAGRYGYTNDKPDRSWAEKLESVARIATREIMDRIYCERFGE